MAGMSSHVRIPLECLRNKLKQIFKLIKYISQLYLKYSRKYIVITFVLFLTKGSLNPYPRDINVTRY